MFFSVRVANSYLTVWLQICSERPKRPKWVSAETEISAKLTEISAEISTETLPNKIAQIFREMGFLNLKFFQQLLLNCVCSFK